MLVNEVLSTSAIICSAIQKPMNMITVTVQYALPRKRPGGSVNE